MTIVQQLIQITPAKAAIFIQFVATDKRQVFVVYVDIANEHPECPTPGGVGGGLRMDMPSVTRLLTRTGQQALALPINSASSARSEKTPIRPIV